jgi:hypothetical protein
VHLYKISKDKSMIKESRRAHVLVTNRACTCNVCIPFGTQYYYLVPCAHNAYAPIPVFFSARGLKYETARAYIHEEGVYLPTNWAK